MKKVLANSLGGGQDELHPETSTTLKQPWNILCIREVLVVNS